LNFKKGSAIQDNCVTPFPDKIELVGNYLNDDSWMQADTAEFLINLAEPKRVCT
jgi:hypothetical protein